MPSADRLDALDDQIHQLIGRLEEIEHKGTVNADRMDRMQADIDLRFKEMQAQAAPVAPPAQPESISMPGATAPNANVGNNSASGPGLAPGPQALGTLSNKDLKQAQSPVPLQPPISLAPPPPKDPQAQYDEAYAAIQKGDDAAAEAGFKAFLARSPNHQLAPNAQYWLAEIVYKRGDFKESAGMFLEAYKKAPKSTKAPDMLYKAGASFAKLDPPRKKEACTAYGLLFSQHPDMPEHVRRAATSDKQKLGCP